MSDFLIEKDYEVPSEVWAFYILHCELSLLTLLGKREYEEIVLSGDLDFAISQIVAEQYF